MTHDIRARVLPTATAFLIHGALLGSMLLLPGSHVGGVASAPLRSMFARDIGSESFFEAAPEVREEVVAASEVVIHDAPVSDHAETDADAPFQESAGVTEGDAVAPFEG